MMIKIYVITKTAAAASTTTTTATTTNKAIVDIRLHPGAASGESL